MLPQIVLQDPSANPVELRASRDMHKESLGAHGGMVNSVGSDSDLFDLFQYDSLFFY